AALALYERILERSPLFYDARVGKAFTLMWMGEKEEAEAIFRWAAKVPPQDPEIKEALAEIGAGGASTTIAGTSEHRMPVVENPKKAEHPRVREARTTATSA